MFQKYNVSNNITDCIKELLRTTNIALVSTWKPGKALIKNMIYITRDYIVKAKQNFTPSNDDGPQSIYDEYYFELINPFVEGQYYKGLTGTYNSNSSLYDSETHYYLGQYLRQLRDLHNIDIMQYYNCWSGEYINNIRLDGKELVNKTKEDGYSFITIPIKFNQKYTIYINSDIPLELTYRYYNGKDIINKGYFNNEQHKQVITIPYCSMNCPFLFEGVNVTGDINSQVTFLDKYLTLFIKIPTHLKSPIVILEGDFIDNKLITINNRNELTKSKIGTFNLTDKEWEKCFNSVSSLTYCDTSYAFNDRLLEYLSWNVITKEDVITSNIYRIQQYLTSTECYLKNKINYQIPYTKGVWDNKLRYFIFNLVANNWKNPVTIDINGYVDKDSEEIIRRGQPNV